MIRTPLTEKLGIKHPVVLGGMGGGTSPELVAAVSNAGGFGILAVTNAAADALPDLNADIRARTQRPFGLNLLLAFANDAKIDAVIGLKPAVFSTAWPRDDQDLSAIFARAHDAGVKVMHMVPTVTDALKAVEAGADIIVAQGTDGGGHIGLIGTSVIVPAVVNAVTPVPVVAAGGIADGRGLAAMLAFGATGVLMGTRFLATAESPLPEALKARIVASDGTDTMVTDVADIASGTDWPGALARVARNRLIERWLGRENELRRRRDEVQTQMGRARREGNVDEALIYMGQSAGLIGEVLTAGEVVARTVSEAEAILRDRLPRLVSS